VTRHRGVPVGALVGLAELGDVAELELFEELVEVLDWLPLPAFALRMLPFELVCGLADDGDDGDVGDVGEVVEDIDPGGDVPGDPGVVGAVVEGMLGVE
jgi:hypothetical protein